MDNWKDIGSNIIKLEGYGLYVTYIDSKVYISVMVPKSGLPTLDPDKNIEWNELEEPSNQKFLNLINARFETSFTMNDFGKLMSISDVKEHVRQQKEMKKDEPMTDNQARWFVKNMREKEK